MARPREGNCFKRNAAWMNSSIEGRNMNTLKLSQKHNLKALKENRYRILKNSLITSQMLTQLLLLEQ